MAYVPAAQRHQLTQDVQAAVNIVIMNQGYARSIRPNMLYLTMTRLSSISDYHVKKWQRVFTHVIRNLGAGELRSGGLSSL